MDCIRCGYSFKYVDRRYPVLVRKEGNRKTKISYQCRDCYEKNGNFFHNKV